MDVKAYKDFYGFTIHSLFFAYKSSGVKQRVVICTLSNIQQYSFMCRVVIHPLTHSLLKPIKNNNIIE